MSIQQQNCLQKYDSELFSIVRRNINSLKQKQMTVRRNAINELNKIVTEKQMSNNIFEQIMHMSLKDIIKCYYDNSQQIRENAIKLTIQLLSRCNNIRPFLPYVFEALKDRTNCVDLQGIDKLPQKLRPQPGQKPKVMLKLIQNCEQIRLIYCQLIKRIILLLQQDKHEMARHLDDVVNILRVLIMDPAPQVQKQACEVLKIFCDQYKGILLHFTQTMGRAVLLPLISKKSKIRIAGLNALTAILWCGLWKYNAFVFQNLIGFRDPNSVPIKDFYEPSNNINYLATFIIDPNVKVRQQFMRHLKIWICDLNDKHDHHGKLVPYLLSGLFDCDQQVKQTALSAIQQIGKQIQQEKQKQFRENKQFAIDAAWTWEGKLIDLPIQEPLKKRPTLGSRYFIRGHVRKFWTALYKQIRDINQQNRLRSANLALYGAIYTQNYLTQFLDNMIPQLLPSILPITEGDRRVADKICQIFYYMGRYCQQSAYIHLMKSALQGKLIQNEQFVKCAMKGLAMQIKGNLDAIPKDQSLCHKKDNIIQLLSTLQQCEISGDVYNFNCIEARQIGESILKGISEKSSKQERQQILAVHFLTLVKLIAVSYFQEIYSNGFSLKSSVQSQANTNQVFNKFIVTMNDLQNLYPQGADQIQDFLSNVFCNPPSLMDSDWKLLTIFYRYFCIKGVQSQEQGNLFLLMQDTICECLTQNKSIELLAFTVKYIYNLIYTTPLTYSNTSLSKSDKLLNHCMKNLIGFNPIKKKPVYQEASQNQQKKLDLIPTNQQNYYGLFIYLSKSLSGYYLNKIMINNSQLAYLLYNYLKCFSKKTARNKECHLQAIKTIWAIFQKLEIDEKFADSLYFQKTKQDKTSEQKQQKQQNNEQQPNKQGKTYVLPRIIDFCVERLQEYLDSRLYGFVFSTLQNIVRAWPKQKMVDKIPSVYPNFPNLLDKLFKYALNERDIQIKQKYMELLQKLARKMPDWFKYESNHAEQQKRFQKLKLIQQVIRNSNI